MSLILKQEPANTIATPPAGKSTLFVNDSSVVSIKSPDGNVTTFPTVTGSNTQVFFNDNGALGGNANLTFNKTTATMSVTNLSVTGNLNAGDISVSSIANGTSNVDIVGTGGNVTTSVGGVANVLVVTTTGTNVTGTFSASGNANAGNLGTTGVFATTLSASGNSNVGNLSVTGSVTATTLSGSLVTGAQPNITSTGTLISLAITGNATAGNVYANSGTIGASLLNGTLTTASQPNITSTGTLTGLGVNGNITAANITANTGVFTGNGSALTALNASNISSGTLAAARLSGTYSISTTGLAGAATNIRVLATDFPGNTAAGGSSVALRDASGDIFATTFRGSGAGLTSIPGANVTGTVPSATTATSATTAGTVTTAAQPNITSTGTLTSASVTGNVTAGNLVTGGILSVTGIGVSSIAGNLNMNSKNITSLATPVNPTDAATKQYVDDFAQGLNIHDSCNAATNTTLATITGGTITYNNGTAGVGANLTTTGSFNLIDGVNVQTSGTRILVKNEANAVHNGIYTWSNATVITRATDYNTVPEVEAGDFTFVTAGTLYDNTGWVQTTSPTSIGGASDFIEFTQFSGAGTYTAGTGLTLTGSVFSVNVAQPTITSVGTLTSLSISGNVNAGNINTSGTETASRFISNVATGTAPFTVTSTTRVANLNVDYANVADTINVTAGTGNNFLIFANAATGNVGEITSTGLTANLSNNSITATTFVGALSGTATSATTAGTVTTAAQGNITSVGTLTSLGVNGTITAVALTANTGVITGNANGISSVQAGNIVGTTLGATVVTSSLTAVGTLSTLSVSGNANVGNIGAGAGIYTTLSASGNVTGGNLVSTGTIGATGATHLGNTFTTGANTTTATVTGNFSLSTGSRFQATYA